MLILASACKDASFMTVMLFIKKLVDIIFIIAPIILILLLTIDFSKAVIEGSEDKINHIKEVSVKRILFAIVLLFVPLIVDTSFSLLPENKSKVIDCYNNASQSNIDKLVEKANAKKAKEEKKAEQRLKKLRKKQEAEAKKRAKNAAEARKKAQQKGNSGSAVSLDSVCTDCAAPEKIAQMAEAIAWPLGTSKSKYYYGYRNQRFSSWAQLSHAKPTDAFIKTMDKVFPEHFSWGTKYPAIRTGQSCDTFVGVVVKATGYDSIGNNLGSMEEAFISHKNKWKKVSTAGRGDICYKVDNSDNHTYIYLGNGKSAEASYGTDFGRIVSKGCKSSWDAWRAIG